MNEIEAMEVTKDKGAESVHKFCTIVLGSIYFCQILLSFSIVQHLMIS